MIAIVDYGRGNLGSVDNAFERLGLEAAVTQDGSVVDAADAVVLPGDGAFHDAMANLESLGLLPALRRALDGRRPFLGTAWLISLFSASEEFASGRGLDVVPGVVRRFPPGRKIPHMGWNQVRHEGRLRLFDGIPEDTYFYFVHSYYPVLEAVDGLGVAWCDYGLRFAAAIERGPIWATQFHPEKSQRWGLRLLENFAAMVRAPRTVTSP
jgi:glutamine amidotransferase